LHATAKKRNADQTGGRRVHIDIHLVLALYAPFFILSFVVIQAFEHVCIDVSDFAINFGLRLGMEVGARIVRRPS
jgi:hypothetical protein